MAYQLCSTFSLSLIEGVQVVFTCPQLLDGSFDTKVITPKVLKSTELELVSPCLLDWWTLLNRTQATPVLKLSVSLVCAGSKDTSDVDTTFEMIAIEGTYRTRCTWLLTHFKHSTHC